MLHLIGVTATPQQVTLIAASIAAAFSLINVIIAARSARAVEARGAHRALLANTLPEIGALLYELVAFSMKMTQMATGESFEAARKQATETARKVDGLRRKTRYALWGIDDGFRTIQWMPVYISHNKDAKAATRAKRIIVLGTSLRESMDVAIMHAYSSGARPTRLQKAIIKFKAWRLRSYFDDGKPSTAQQADSSDRLCAPCSLDT